MNLPAPMRSISSYLRYFVSINQRGEGGFESIYIYIYTQVSNSIDRFSRGWWYTIFRCGDAVKLDLLAPLPSIHRFSITFLT